MWNHDYGYGASFWVWRLLSFGMSIVVIVVAIVLVYYFINRIKRGPQHSAPEDHSATQEQQSKILATLESIQKELRELKKKK